MPCLKHRIEEAEALRQAQENAFVVGEATARNLTVYLAGTQDGEHLRAEVKGDEVVLISHELATSYISTRWRDRVLVSIPLRLWRAVAAMTEG